MTQEHPITPPPELVKKWHDDWLKAKVKHVNFDDYISTQAARWGADQELEACCKWASQFNYDDYRYQDELQSFRRPKPPSLKEQALLAIDTAVADGRLSPDVSNVVRRALEQLDD